MQFFFSPRTQALSMMLHLIGRLLIAGGLGIPVTIVGSLMLSSCSTHSSRAEKAIDNEAISVKIHDVAVQEQRGSITATGLLTTEHEAKYAFKIGGVIERIAVREGQYFKKGDLLATLRMTEIEAGVQQARIAYNKAQRDYERVLRLYRDSVATLEQLQNTQSALDLAQRQLEAVEFNKQYASIYAQSAGFITKKLANEGEVIAGGSPVFAVNEPQSAGWILRLGVTDKEWAQITLGDQATIMIDAFPGQLFTGVVSQKAQAADPQSGSLQIEIRLQEQQAFAVGMYAKATITTRMSSTHTSIPYSALIEASGNRAFVFVPTEQNKVRKVPITIGGFDNSGIHVVAGLEGVRTVVISNSAFLNEQSTITIVK